MFFTGNLNKRGPISGPLVILLFFDVRQIWRLFSLRFFLCRSFCLGSFCLGSCSRGSCLRSHRLSGDHVNDVTRASLGTQSAVLALVRIDGCVVVFHLDGLKLTCLFAQLAADTSGVADLTGQLSGIGGGASYPYAGLLGNQLDQGVGAGLGAGAAGDALFHVDPGNTVDNLDGIVLTCSDAVAEADTAVLALSGAAEEALGSGAGREALIFHGGLRYADSASAVYAGNLGFGRTGIYAQYRCDSSSSSSTAGGTHVGSQRMVSSQSCCIVITAGKAAAAAVCAGQAFSDLNGGLVHGNGHELSS